MCQGKQIFGFKIEHRLIFTLLILLLASCKNERPQTVVTTPTPAPTVESIAAIDPTIAAVLAQTSPTPELTATTDPNSSPTQTPEFVCEPPANWVAYTVQPNDTLIALANALGISVGDIKNANCKLDDALIVGETLYLPAQPPIPQVVIPANQQPLTPPNNLQELPDGIVQELANFTGGGGSHSIARKCIYDGEPQILIESGYVMRYSSTIEIFFCNPQTDSISITLILPNGEKIPLDLYSLSGIEELNPSILGAYYSLPLGHLYGTYTVLFEDYPEPGASIERQVEIQKSLPTMRMDFETEELHLYYFEPNELIQLAAYKPTNIHDLVEFAFVQTYQINEDGYLTIQLEPKWKGHGLAAYGEQSGFVSDELGAFLSITNNRLEPLCQLSLAPSGTKEWIDLAMRLEVGFSEVLYVLPSSYDIEIRNCNDDVVYSENNVSITEGATGGDAEKAVFLEVP